MKTLGKFGLLLLTACLIAAPGRLPGQQPVAAPQPVAAADAAGVSQLIREAQAAQAAERFEEAVRLARRAVELDPAHPPAWRQYGLALWRGGDAPAAIAPLQRAVEMDERDTTAWRGLAQACWQAQRRPEAVRALSAYLRLKPEEAPVWRDLAAWLTHLDRRDEAVAALKRVVELKPDDAAAWRELGLLQQRGGRASEAIAAFERAVAARPGDAATRRDLGWLLWSAGRRDAGVARLAEAVEGGVTARERVISQVVARLSEEGAGAQALAFMRRVNPDTPPSELGLALARAGRLRAAEPILASAWRNGEQTPDVGLYLAYARAVNAQFDELATYLDPLLKSGQTLSRERADLALEALRLGSTRPEAPAIVSRLESVLEKGDRYSGRVTQILETSAAASRMHDAPEQALQLYRRVLERDPERPVWPWAVLLAERLEGRTPYGWLEAYAARVTNVARRAGVTGLLSERRGRPDEAIPALRQSLALDPRQPLLRQVLFNSLLSRGEVEEARGEAAWFARQVESGEVVLRSNLAEMLTRLGDTGEALSHWELLRQENPDLPYYGLETAMALQRLGRTDQAVELLRTMADATPDPRIFELLAEIASVRGYAAEVVAWAERGLAETPSQGLRRYHAENLEILQTNAPAALASAREFLRHDAGYVPLTLLAGRMLEKVGDSDKAYKFHRWLLSRNPLFVPSLTALRDRATLDGRNAEAVGYARTRAELHPENVEAARALANSLAQHDRFQQALQILRPLADLPLDKAMPVLVYQSITSAPEAGRNSVAQLGRHLRRLADDGAVFVNEFGRRADKPDARRVMIVLLDPAPDVVEALDPLLQRYNARVVYAGNAAMPGLTLAGQPIPKRVAALLAGERWRLAAGGPADTRRQPVDEAGTLGNPLTHALMLDGARETAAACAARLDGTLGAAAGTLRKLPQRLLVYPSGDFGQRSLDTDAGQLALLRAAVARHFTHAIYFDDSGFHLDRPESDPLRIPARLVPPEWDETALATYLGAGHPLTRARLELARVLYWNGQHEEANSAFAEAERAGADRFDLLLNWGLNADRQGDVPAARARLEAALALQPDDERVRRALARLSERRRPRVSAEVSGWDDNEGRDHLRYGVQGDIYTDERLRFSLSAGRNRWASDGLGDEEGTRLGASGLAFFNRQSWIEGSLWRLLMDDLDDHWGGQALLRLPTPWLGGDLSLVAGREEIDTVEALRADIYANTYSLRGYARLVDVLDLFADAASIARDDDNDTTMFNARLLYRLKEWPYAGIGWRVRLADSDYDPPAYWAPEELEQHQLHAALRGVWGALHGAASLDAGYARERDTDWRFVWGARGSLDLTLTRHLRLSGEIGWFEGPEYERLAGRLGLSSGF